MHLLEFHWNTVVVGGGLVLLIVLVVALTYCCVRGYLQACCLNTCRLCCPHDHGVGGDLEAQDRQGQGAQAQASGGTLVQASGGARIQATTAPQAPPAAVAMKGTGVVERLGYQRTLEDILASHRAKNRRCGLCHGIGHSYGQCPTVQEMM